MNLKKHMHAKSKLIVTYPIGGNYEFFLAAQEAMSKLGLSYPEATIGTKLMRDPDKARQLLSDVGYQIAYFQVVDARQPFGSESEFIDWLEGTCGGNWNNPLDSRRSFFTDLAHHYLTLKPLGFRS